jgi:hypothetical protein
MTLIKTVYRNKIEAALQILPEQVEDFDRKTGTRTRPESKRLKRKAAHESRRRNRA